MSSEFSAGTPEAEDSQPKIEDPKLKTHNSKLTTYSLPLRILLVLGRGSGNGRPKGILRVWPLWERIDRRLHGVAPLPGSTHGSFDVSVRRYRGLEMAMPDGTAVRSGDRIVEIHLNNPVLLQRQADGRRWSIYTAIMDDLRALARWLENRDRAGEIKAVFGLSVLARGAAKMGFSVRERPVTIQARLDRFFATGLLLLYSAERDGRFGRGTTLGVYPREIWLSRTELTKRYGSSLDASPSARA